MTTGLLVAGVVGFFGGGFVFLFVGLITFWVVSRNHKPIVRKLEKLQTYTYKDTGHTAPVILTIKSDAEEAWEAIQISNSARGGITEHELKNL